MFAGDAEDISRRVTDETVSHRERTLCNDNNRWFLVSKCMYIVVVVVVVSSILDISLFKRLDEQRLSNWRLV